MGVDVCQCVLGSWTYPLKGGVVPVRATGNGQLTPNQPVRDRGHGEDAGRGRVVPRYDDGCMAAMDAGDAGQDAARDAREDARQDVPAEGMTVAEAARQLGLSTAALRKRIKRGSLPALKVGEQWYVSREGVDAAGAAERAAAPDTGSPSGSPSGPDTGHSPGTGPARDAAYDAGRDTPDTGRDTGRDGEVRRLEEQVALLHEEVTVRRREVQQLHTLLAQAQQLALPAPAAPVDRPATRQNSQDEHQGDRPDATPQRRSWWKFW